MAEPETRASRQPCWPQAQTGAARVDDDVADLAGQAAGAAMEPAVEDDAGRDAGPDREIGEVVDVADDAAPWRPRAAARTSFSTTHGRPRRASRRVPERQVRASRG